MSFAELLSYISTLTVFIPFFYCLPALRKKDKAVVALFILLCISVLISIVSELNVHTGSSNSLLYFNLYTLLEFIGVSFIYVSLLHQWKTIIYIVMVLFTLFFTGNCLW